MRSAKMSSPLALTSLFFMSGTRQLATLLWTLSLGVSNAPRSISTVLKTLASSSPKCVAAEPSRTTAPSFLKSTAHTDETALLVSMEAVDNTPVLRTSSNRGKICSTCSFPKVLTKFLPPSTPRARTASEGSARQYEHTNSMTNFTSSQDMLMPELSPMATTARHTPSLTRALASLSFPFSSDPLSKVNCDSSAFLETFPLPFFAGAPESWLKAVG
mmetsp:Transcript_20995/g.39319  ORF Transcript_20995/g.39319 Transcript_20995/m.39319 type:complete len:216 (-) Transcript_20995:160-807(-)